MLILGGASAMTVALAGTATASPFLHGSHKEMRARYLEPDHVGTSTQYGGYTASTKGSSVKFTMSLTVPKITCPTSAGPLMSAGAELTGKYHGQYSNSGGQIDATCNAGTPTYSASIQTHEAKTSRGEAVAPGDSVIISGSSTATKESYKLTDKTSGATIHLGGPGLKPTSLQVATTAIQSAGPIAKFGAITFRSVKINGKSLSKFKPFATNEVDSAGHVLIRVTSLAAKGTEFSTKFVAGQ
jgi:hypothetical protein